MPQYNDAFISLIHFQELVRTKFNVYFILVEHPIGYNFKWIVISRFTEGALL